MLSMNKYQTLISKLTLEQKLKLLVSNKYIENSQIEDYVVPNLKIEFNFKDMMDDFINPSAKSLGALYDSKLVEEYGMGIGKYLSSIRLNRIINIPCNPIQDDNNAFSSSRLVSAINASSLAKGIEKGGFLASYGIIPSLNDIDLNSYYNDDLYSFKVAFKKYKPFACVINSPDSLDVIIDDYKYDGLKIVIVKNQKELINSLNHFVELSITSGFNVDFNQLVDSITKYKIEKNKLVNDEISTNDFKNMIIKSEILNPEAVDEALCSLLDKLNKMEEHYNQDFLYDINILNEIEYRVSRQSVVLLKNNNILPLARENTFAFMGDALFNPILNTKIDREKIDVEELIDSYHLETKGISHGYLLGTDDISEELLVKSKRLATEAMYSIIFLRASDGKIPENQIALLNRIKNNTESKIIPILLSNTFTDITPLLEYDAIIMQFSDSKSNIRAVLDVIVGRFNPTARLPFALKNDVSNMNFKDSSNLIYSLGHGLSYSNFNYKSITINENGIVLAVTNESKIPGTEILFFTTKYLDNLVGEYNYIRDYIAVELEGHESKLVEFKYNFDSFAVYDVNNNERLIREGNYQIQLMNEFDSVLESKNIHLDKLSEKNISSLDLEENYDNFKESFNALKYEAKTPRTYIPNSLKLVTLIIINLYLIIMAVYIAIYIDHIAAMIIAPALALIVLIISILIYRNSVRRSKEKEKKETLTDMVNDFPDYDVSVHETFSEPIPVIEEDVLEEEEIVEEVEPEIQKTFIYDAFGEQIIDDLVYTNSDTFEDLVDRYQKYALNKGVMIEGIYAKQLFATILSSNLVLISGENKEKNIEAIKILNEFLGNSANFYMDLEGKEKIDIYWNIDDSINYRLSDFSNNIIRTNYLPKRFNLLAFNGINNDTINLISEYIEFGMTPLKNHSINIGENHVITIPSNTVIILFVDSKLDNEDLYFNSLSLDLVTNNNKLESEEVILKYNDYQYIKTLIDRARNQYFIEEDIWRKIDTIFDNQVFNDFKLSNKDVATIEKLSSVLMDLKFDMIQSLNYSFILRLIPILLVLEKKNSPSFRQTVIELFDNALEDKVEATIKTYRNS